MDKLNIYIDDFITDNRMPATMAVVALTTFTYVDCCFDFKSHAISLINRLIDKIWIALIVVVFVRATRVHCIRKNIGNQSAKIIALDKIPKWPPYFKQHTPIDHVKNGLGLIQCRLKLGQR